MYSFTFRLMCDACTADLNGGRNLSSKFMIDCATSTVAIGKVPFAFSAAAISFFLVPLFFDFRLNVLTFSHAHV